MPKLRLTARAVESLCAPDPSGKQVLHWDTELRGFGVLVSGRTNAKTFIVQREINGRTRRVTVGPTNVLSLTAARLEAQKVLATFYQGKDPKAATGRATLRSTLESYLAHGRLRGSTVGDYRRAVESHLAAWLDRPLTEITAQMVLERHAAIAGEVKAAGRYSGEAAANGTMRTLRTLWNHAATLDPDLPNNPCAALRRHWFHVSRRTRLVKPEQLKTFYAGVQALENKVAADYLKLILFTGMRREEAAQLEWREVDLKRRTIHLDPSRTKTRRGLALPLTDVSYDLLAARHAIGTGKYVFPAKSRTGGPGHIAEPKFPLGLVADATGIQVSVHDLRRTYETVAESCDISPMALKSLIGHSLNGDVTAGYVIMTPERLREPAQKVTDRLKQLCGLPTKRKSR